MAFRKRVFNRVESDSGFIVKIRAYGGYVEYREGKRIAIIPVQPVMGKILVNVYTNTPVQWNSPHSSESISEDKRLTILKNVVDAMRFRKYTVELVGTPDLQQK